MKKKLTCALFLGALLFACVGAGCNNLSKIEENQEDGYMVSVSYDANGGSFLNRPGITVMDMFKPSNYTKDANGIVHIKLTEPTERQAVGTDDITLTLQNHFFAGWYQNREVKTVDGKPVDEAGSELALVEGEYYYANTLDSFSVCAYSFARPCKYSLHSFSVAFNKFFIIATRFWKSFLAYAPLYRQCTCSPSFTSSFCSINRKE